jgi:ATP-dependent Clp protease ATP-binding subunit ClpA
LDNLRAEVERQVGTGPDQKIVGNIPYTPRVKKVLALAQKEMRQLNHAYVGTEHLLLGMLREGDGVAAKALQSLDVDLEKTRQEILRLLDPNFLPQSDDAASRLTTPADAKEALKNLTPPTQEPAKSKSDPVDARKRYDVYCVERNQETLVYRNAKINGTKRLAPSHGQDGLPDFAEFEQSDGQIVLVALNSVVKICEHGVKPNAERVQE